MQTANKQRPQTYFLQEAIDRGLHAISHRLDHKENSRPYFLLKLAPVPDLEHHIWDWGDMCSRFTDAFLLGRQATGCSELQEAEQDLRKLLPTCDPFLNPFMAGRMLIAFVDLYLDSPSEKRRMQIDELARVIRSKLVFEGDYAYLFRYPDGWNSMENAVFGDFSGYTTFPLGGIMLGLTRYTEIVKAEESEDLLDRLYRFVLNVSGTFDAEGKFQGHTHSGGILTAAVAIMRRALRVGDERAVRRMKNAFDWTLQYSSSWGWIPDGLGPEHASCETCSITDCLHLGLLIARHIDPGYYAIVERFARNQLLENQFVHPERMLPKDAFPNRESIANALHGSWASWSLPNSLDNCTHSVEGCCLGAGVRACFLVWDDIVAITDDTVIVNMGLSRNSEWVEIIGYQPFEGKLEIVVHDAPILKVRIPDWVRHEDLHVLVEGQPVSYQWCGSGYIELRQLEPGQLVRILYPLESKMVVEKVSGQEYNVKWRGDTVISVTPAGRVYPLFERKWMEEDAAPMVQTQPFAAQMGGPIHW